MRVRGRGEARREFTPSRALVVRLAAAPVDGAANAELVETLAEALGLARRDVTLVRGGSSRTKVIAVRGLSASEVRARLTPAL